jgi:hypothetical protein
LQRRQRNKKNSAPWKRNGKRKKRRKMQRGRPLLRTNDAFLRKIDLQTPKRRRWRTPSETKSLSGLRRSRSSARLSSRSAERRSKKSSARKLSLNVRLRRGMFVVHRRGMCVGLRRGTLLQHGPLPEREVGGATVSGSAKSNVPPLVLQFAPMHRQRVQQNPTGGHAMREPPATTLVVVKAGTALPLVEKMGRQRAATIRPAATLVLVAVVAHTARQFGATRTLGEEGVRTVPQLVAAAMGAAIGGSVVALFRHVKLDLLSQPSQPAVLVMPHHQPREEEKMMVGRRQQGDGRVPVVVDHLQHSKRVVPRRNPRRGNESL